MNTTEVRDYLLGLQRSIVSQLEQVDGNAFLSDGWTREPGGRLGRRQGPQALATPRIQHVLPGHGSPRLPFAVVPAPAPRGQCIL